MPRPEFKQKNKSMYLMLTLLACVLAMMVMLAKCSHSPATTFNTHPVKSGGDTIDVAIQMNPAVYRVRGDSVSGRDYELLMALSRHAGVPVKLHPFVPLQWAVDRLNDGTFDLLVASLPSTTTLKDSFLMTDPVYIDREVLVQVSDSATLITSQMQLAGDTLWLPSGAPVRPRIENLAEEIGEEIYIMSDESYTAEHLFMLVARGEIRYAVINEDIAHALLPRYPQVDASLPVSFSQFQAWALRKDNYALRDSVNTWLKAITDK